LAIIYYDQIRMTLSEDESEFVVELLTGNEPHDPDGLVWDTMTPDTADLIDGSAWSSLLGVDNEWWEGL